MSYLSKSYVFREGTLEDGPEMLKILEQPDFPGDLNIIYTRRPNPVQSYREEGIDTVILVCRRKCDGRMVGFGCCIINNHYFQGEVQTIGYLTGLRISREFRMIPKLLTDAYDAMMEMLKQKGISLLLTTVLDDNAKVQQMFEKPRKNFPYYLPVTHFTVHCGTVRMAPPKEEYLLMEAKAEDHDELSRFLNNYGGSRDFYPMVHDFSGFIIARNAPDGEIVAAAKVWYQKAQKQHILVSYGGIYRVLRWFGPLLPLVGYPKLPKENTMLNYYTLSYYGFKEGHLDALEALIRYASMTNRSCNYFIMGTVTGTLEDHLLKRLTKITYCSKVYLVDYKKTKTSEAVYRGINRPYIECGML